MKLAEIGVRQPVLTTMVFLAILVLGGVSYTRLPVDLLPEMENPSITVSTTWMGASTADVENKVTRVIEKQLATVSDLSELTSRTREGLSTITCLFEWGTDLNEAANDIRDKLEFAKRQLPKDADKPIVLKFNSASMPIIFFGATAKESWEGLYDLIDREVGDQLKRVTGVGAVQVFGGLERQVNIDLDPIKLAGYGLTVSAVQRVIAAENLTLPAGNIKSGAVEFTIRVPGEYSSPDQIGNIVLKRNDGAAVYLRDVATVSDGFTERQRYSEVNHRDAVMFMVQKRSGANTVQVARDVRREVERLQRQMPSDVKLSVLADTSDFIEQSLGNVSRTVLWGGFFVVLTTLFFLRSLRSSAVILLTIPFSLIISFVFMFFKGWTINVVTLSALAIAIGMVVDNAVVVLENISSRMDRGENRAEAAMFGTDEVGLAISASTLTTVVVFVPLIFVTGTSGVFFGQLGGIVSITLLASLLCSLMLTPMLSSRWLTVVNETTIGGGRLGRWVFHVSEAGFVGLERFYERTLAWSLRHRLVVLTGALLLFCSSLALTPLIGTEYAPSQDSGDLSIRFELPVGTRVEATTEICRKIVTLAEAVIPADWIVHSRWQCGGGGFGGFGGRSASHLGNVDFKLASINTRTQSSRDLGRAVIERMRDWPEITRVSMSTENRAMGRHGGGGKPIVVQVLGFDLAETSRIAQQIKVIADRIPGAKDASISLDPGKPEWVVDVDRLKASTLGLNVSDIVETIRTLFYGLEASTYREGENEFRIYMRLAERRRISMKDILDSEIGLPDGRRVRIDAVATVHEALGPQEIERMDQERMVTVGLDTDARSVGEVADDLRRAIEAEVVVPLGVSIHYGGLVQEQTEAFLELQLLLVLGLVLVYMVMAAQFESFKDPFIIVLSLPFAFTGVVYALLGFGMTFNIFTYIGMILLVGTVVNNAIVLVDYINILRARGESLVDAVRHSGRQRLRPVLITTLTTVFGMMPLALAHSEGSETWKPMGVTVVGGLSFATLVTLLVVPVVYSLLHRDRPARAGKA
jgi:HAE1 family hydrophobic/amphiphilic exporter-1